MDSVPELSEFKKTVGQLFMAGIPGPFLDKDTERLIRDFNVGGVLLFSRNITDPVQLAELCHAIQKTSIKFHGKPVFIAIDQEGGKVARLKKPFTLFPGNEAVGACRDPVKRAGAFGHVTAREMKMVGLNMNLAPVVDVRRDNTEKNFKPRTFSEDHKLVGVLGATVIKALQEGGVMAVAKHFPGLGYSEIDPHFNLPRIDLGAEEIHRVNIQPFISAIGENVSGIMTSHAIYSAIDNENPATLSPKILGSLLREKLGFKGLVLSDDLEMGAIAKKWGVAEGALASFKAGTDILLICKDQSKVLESIGFIKDSLEREEIPEKRLIDSVVRISKARSRLPQPRGRVAYKSIENYFNMYWAAPVQLT